MQQTPFDSPAASRFRAPPPKRSPARLVAVIALLVVALGAVGVGGFVLLQQRPIATSTPTPTPTLIGALYQADLTSNPGNWDCSPPTSCAFRSDGYHIQAAQKDALAQSVLLTPAFD